MKWFLLAAGAVMVVVGCWGWRNISQLIPPTLSEESRNHQKGVLQRGSTLLLLVGVGFVAFAIYQMFVG